MPNGYPNGGGTPQPSPPGQTVLTHGVFQASVATTMPIEYMLMHEGYDLADA